MNYKIACMLFRQRFNIYAKRGVVIKNKIQTLHYEDMQDREILTLLGQIQADIGNRYRLLEKQATVDLILNQYKYTVGSGASNIPSDIIDLWEIKLNNATQDSLTRVGVQDMPPQTLPVYYFPSTQANPNAKPSGLPRSYTLYYTGDNRTLEIDSNPDMSYSTTNSAYRLIVFYYARLDYFTGAAVASTCWSDYNESSTTDYGGSFKIPEEWHSVLIDGALAYLFPDMIGQYQANLQELIRQKPLYITTRLKGYLGVENFGTDVQNSNDSNNSSYLGGGLIDSEY